MVFNGRQLFKPSDLKYCNDTCIIIILQSESTTFIIKNNQNYYPRNHNDEEDQVRNQQRREQLRGKADAVEEEDYTTFLQQVFFIMMMMIMMMMNHMMMMIIIKVKQLKRRITPNVFNISHSDDDCYDEPLNNRGILGHGNALLYDDSCIVLFRLFVSFLLKLHPPPHRSNCKKSSMLNQDGFP